MVKCFWCGHKLENHYSHAPNTDSGQCQYLNCHCINPTPADTKKVI